MNDRVAVPLEGFPSVCTLPNGNRLETALAIKRGFAIADRSKLGNTVATAVKPKTDISARIAYLTAIEALPEAASRPAAAAVIWSKYTMETMPPERAASFLRGLPTETKPVASAPSRLTATDIAVFKRKVELRIVGLNMKADAGNNQPARVEARRLSEALATRERTGCSFGSAFTAAGLPARETIEKILR